MKGVTQRVYDGYRMGRGPATRPVKGITTDALDDIYDRQYWDAVQGAPLPAGAWFNRWLRAAMASSPPL